MLEKIKGSGKDENEDEPTFDYVGTAKDFALEYYKHLFSYEKNKKKEGTKDNEYYKYFRDEIDAYAAILKKLLDSPNFYGVNIVEEDVTNCPRQKAARNPISLLESPERSMD